MKPDSNAQEQSRSTQSEVPIVCFAGCDWWYHNRGLFVPQVMTRLARFGKVVFVNSLGMRVPTLGKDKGALKKVLRKLSSMARYLRRDPPTSMYVLSPLSVPLKNPRAREWNRQFLLTQLRMVFRCLHVQKPIFYIGSPPAWEVVKELPRSLLVYERTDIFSEMPGVDKEYIARLDDHLARTADIVIYVNRKLWEEGVKKNPNSILLGHGVDFELFARAEESSEIPSDIQALPRPVVGFFGDISDKTSDLALLEHVARAMPEVSFALVGGISTDVSRLRAVANIHFLGKKNYVDIPHYGKNFDVAIMPWNQNRWIEFCNPVKAKEYLALGRPIVSTYYPEVEPYRDLIYIARDADDFVTKLRIALAEEDPALRARRREIVRTETWDQKVAQLRTKILASLSPNS